MSSEVKRYSVVLHVANDSPFRQTGDSCTRPIRTDVVLATDYAALEAECERLREKLYAAIETCATYKQQSMDARAELAAIKGQEPVAFYWQDIGYPEPRKHGPYFGWPSESALRNVDGGAIPVPLYALPHAPRAQEGT